MKILHSGVPGAISRPQRTTKHQMRQRLRGGPAFCLMNGTPHERQERQACRIDGLKNRTRSGVNTTAKGLTYGVVRKRKKRDFKDTRDTTSLKLHCPRKGTLLCSRNRSAEGDGDCRMAIHFINVIRTRQRKLYRQAK
jgi:hypothetical protein